ncbi:MAG: AraC family ligand binding domain-containing protein [Ginsengibacter sp.]
MEIKKNESTELRPEGGRLMDAPLVSMDIPQFIKQIKSESTWENSDRNALTVYKTNGMRIVLIALHANAEMTRHTADGIINLQILEGQIRFNTDEQSVELNKGQMLTLHKGIPHSVLAKEETIFLLTLTTTSAEIK